MERNRSRKRIGFGLVLVAGLCAGTATAPWADELTGSELEIRIGWLPPIVVEQSADPFSLFQTSGFSVDMPGGAFTIDDRWVSTFFTGVPLISFIAIEATLSEGSFAPGWGLNGGFGGAQPLEGTALIGILGGLFPGDVGLSAVGQGGVIQGGAMTLRVTVTGHLWTTGRATVTGVTTQTLGGAWVNTVTMTGSDQRTTSHSGSLTLVTPVRIFATESGALPAFFAQRLEIVQVPEPSAILLVAGAVSGLVGLGLARSRRR